ncbi:MAG TPA: polyamine aminopropyltransferase [Microvirga sp.]|nr:polyamine aminopropyltransferase [Microvirga sp.]
MRWFQEKLYEHHKRMLSIDTVLYHWRTLFQDVLIFENAVFGKVLVLDGIVQLTELDTHIRCEMMAHVPLMAHGSARNVLIIGGGDGGTLREVLKHPVERATLVERDDEVIDLSRRFLPMVSGGAFDDPRANTVAMDGTQYVTETDDQFDVIIIDTTDPAGPGEPLFTSAFYRACRSRLRPGGMMVVQSGAPYFRPDELEMVCDRLSGAFSGVRPYLAPVPAYAGGMLALVASGESHDVLCPPCEVLQQRFSSLRAQTRYYTPEVHQAAFMLALSFAPALRRGNPTSAGLLKTGT